MCGSATLSKIFKIEISSDVLKDMLAAIDTCWMSHAGAAEEGSEGSGAALGEAKFVVQILDALTGTGRFSLTVKLLGGSSKQVLQALFVQLQAAAKAHAAAVECGEAKPSAGSEQRALEKADVVALALLYVVKL
eukprot:gene6841-30818_t